MTTIFISKEVINVFNYLVRSVDVEVAGFLLGIPSGNSIYVKELVVGDNLDSSPISFKLDPYAIIGAYELAKTFNLEVVALIHSHPAPPYPSIKDIAGMKLWPIPWVIVDSVGMEVRTWILKQGGIEEVLTLLT